MVLQSTRRQFTVDEYERMAEAGILLEDDRVELIEGEIIEMAPIGSRHNSCVIQVTYLFQPALGTAAQVRGQSSLRLNDRTELQPDLAIVRWRSDFYRAIHPVPEDVFLLIEIADSSARHDRQVKLPLYAQSGIPEFWLVDLVTDTIEIYREPSATGYAFQQVVSRGETLTALAFPDQVFKAEDILG